MDWTGLTTQEVADALADGLEELRERLDSMERDPSVTAEGFARVIEQCAEVLEEGVHADLAADLRAQGLALISQARLDGRS